MAGENETVNNENVNPEIQLLQVIVQFLNRVDLKGQEVPAFNAAIEYLQKRAQEVNSESQPEIVSGASLPNANE